MANTETTFQTIPHTTDRNLATGTEPRQYVHWLWKGALLILVLTALFVAYLLVKPGPPQSLTLVDNLIQGLLEGVGFFLALPLWLFWGMREKPSDDSLPSNSVVANPGQRWVPVLLSLGILSYVIGQAIWTYNENIAHLSVLFPSWADAGFLGSYPFVLLAILLLPRRPLPVQTRVRIFLDGLIIMAGVVTFSWYFVLGPTILQGADTVAGQIIGTAYPLATLVLIFCLLLLAVRSQDRELQPILLLLSLAFLIIVATDTIYDYQELHNLYNTGSLLDVGWPLGYMLVGLSARGMQLQLTSRRPAVPAPAPYVEKSESIEPPSSLERALIPLLFVSSVIFLLIWTRYEETNMALQAGVFLGVTVLLVLMVVRQVFLIQETISQNRLLRTTQQDLLARNEALRQANIQLEAQARIKAAFEEQRRLNELKDQFILNVSHELRTPLTQVYGYLELIETYHHTLQADKQMTFIQKAMQGCRDLVPIIDTILQAGVIDSHTTPLEAQELVVANIIQEVLEEFKLVQLQEYSVALEIAEGLVVQADPQSLRQVLRNLLSNAFKYTPPRSTVQVIARRCDPAAQRPDVPSQVCICVQDTGPGIPPEDIPLLFGKFVRLKRDLAGSVPGTGLGLYISKQLVEAMGGSIWVESSGIAGQGSRFYFTLPARTR